MALTLRLSDEEINTLKSILPDHPTSSGKLKHMIMSWGSLQREVRILREDLERERTVSNGYLDQLSEVKGALKVLGFFSRRGSS